MIRRAEPQEGLRGVPCLIVAVSCARGAMLAEEPELKEDGYATLAVANKYIRQHLNVKKRIDYKRGDRPRLSEFLTEFSGKALICVLGHFLYADGSTYYSFFDNEQDDVVSVWLLKDEQMGC